MSTETISRDERAGETTHGATLVTGASSGIGAEFARQFAAAGDDLILVARREARLESLASELEAAHGIDCTVVSLDLTAPDAIAELAERVFDAGLHVDTLVNDAGIGVYGDYHETDAEQERAVLDLNVVALTELTKAVVPGMVERRRGRILNVASLAAVYPIPGGTIYGATKAYVLSYSLALAEELRPHGITVTALCPGVVDTGWLQNPGVENSGLTAQRMTTADEVAQAGYEGLVAGKAIVVPTTNTKLLWHATRFLSRTRAAKMAKAYWEG